MNITLRAADGAVKGAIAGFDDIKTLRDFHPALSTARLPLDEIGRLAVLGTAAGGSTSDGGTTVPVTGQVTLRRCTEPVSEAAP